MLLLFAFSSIIVFSSFENSNTRHIETGINILSIFAAVAVCRVVVSKKKKKIIYMKI